MVTFLLLNACGPPQRSVDTIHGVQVVAIQADPPQPEKFDQVSIDVWVADGIGLGTEVLVWLCTPVDDRCLEAGPPEVNGLPLQLWTEVGSANPKMSMTTTFWPLLVSTGLDQIDPSELPEEVDDGYLVVWALACVPGFCPFLEDVRIGPLPGSDAWNDIADGLAHPSDWVAAAPKGYASLALKLIPLWRPDEPNEPDFTFDSTSESDTPNGRNRAPQISVAESHAPVPAPIDGWPPLWIRFDESDPDAEDALSSAAFVTSGLLTKTELLSDGFGDNTKTADVLWSPQAADADRSPQMFFVVDDGRGGTAVWSSVPEVTSNACDRPAEVEFTNPEHPGDPVVALLTEASPGQVASILVNGAAIGIPSPTNHHVSVEMRAAATGQLLATTRTDLINPLRNWDQETCTATFDGVLERADSLEADSLCSFGGALVDLVARVIDLDSYEEPVATTIKQAHLQLDESLPCLQDD